MYVTHATATNKAAEVIPIIPPVEKESSTSAALESSPSSPMTMKVDGVSLGNDDVLSRVGTIVGCNTLLGASLTVSLDGEELGETVTKMTDGTADG